MSALSVAKCQLNQNLPPESTCRRYLDDTAAKFVSAATADTLQVHCFPENSTL